MTEVASIPDTNGSKTNDAENNTEEETDLQKAIIRQVEYYFGDINLPRDKFLREQIQLDDGWVPFDILIRFNRLAKLTTDYNVIADALKSSSELLEVSEDKKKVRRNPELPIPEMNEDRRKELTAKTIYAKGFSKDASLDDVLKYFKQFDGVENIIMRKYADRKKQRHFKGSVFATFKTKEQAEKFINLKDLKYGDNPLLILWQEKYAELKQEEFASKRPKKEKKNKETNEKPEFTLPAGTVLQFKEGHNKMSRENIKDALAPFGFEVAYVDFQLGDTEGYIRLAKENNAKELFEKLTDGKLKVDDSELVFRVLDEDEEKSFLVKTVEEMSKRRKNQKNFKQKNKNFKNKFNKKRKQDRHEDEPASKVKADDS